MRKYLIIITAFLLIPSFALAANVTLTASSCAYDNVSAKVSDAQVGDTTTIIIPAGDCTGANKWTSTLSFGAKQIYLQGNGIDRTIIEGTTTTIDMGTGGSQISHMTINEAKVGARNGTAWVIHDVKFYSATLKDLLYVWPTSATHATGLVHSCTFYNNGIWIAGVYGTSAQMGTVWTDVPAPGATDQMVYVENNTFIRDYVSAGSINIIDGVYGARVVFRYNTITTNSEVTALNAAMYCEAHGCEGGRAFQYFEYYNNLNVNNGGAMIWAYSFRGGTGIVFNNSHTGNWANKGAWVDNFRSSSAPANSGLCNGSAWGWDGNEAITNGTGTHTGGDSTTVLADSTKTWTTNALVGMTITDETDGGLTGYHAGSYCIITSNTSNTATCAGLASGTFNNGDTYKISSGYPCRDNIGRGYDASAWDLNSASEYTEVLMPIYAWSNLWDSTEYNIRVKAGILNADQIQANRDFYNYTASFDGTVGVGKGLDAAKPATCTTGVAYFSTDVGAYGTLYKCTSTNTWTSYFAPSTCPHASADPLNQGSCDSTKYGANPTGATDGSYVLTGGESDTTAPTVLSVYVNGDEATVNFSESITATSGAAFTLDPSGADVTVTCPAVTTAATSMVCTISRALTAAETVKYAYTGTKIVDTASNALAEISATDITGNQTPAEAPTKKLTITKTGSGCVVTSTPSGINCGSTCEFDFTTATAVTLGSYFVNEAWNGVTYSGGCAGGTADLTNDVADCVVTCISVKLLN